MRGCKMDFGITMFALGVSLSVFGVFLVLKKDSMGIKNIQAIANAKNQDIGTLNHDMKYVKDMISQWSDAQKKLAIKCDSNEAIAHKAYEMFEHQEKLSRSLQLDIELLKQKTTPRKRDPTPVEIIMYQSDLKKPPVKQITKAKEVSKQMRELNL